MYSAEDCRERARQCVERAQSARESERPMLLKLAQEWLVLADELISAAPDPHQGSTILSPRLQ
jgi:hypothetical protein